MIREERRERVYVVKKTRCVLQLEREKEGYNGYDDQVRSRCMRHTYNSTQLVNEWSLKQKHWGLI